MVIVQNLRHQYATAAQLVYPDFECQNGDTTLILGQSGCGKTTLLYLMGGLLGVQEGVVRVGGVNLKSLRPRELAAFRRERVSIVFQQSHLVAALTVLENVEMARFFSRKKTPARTTTNLLEALNISHLADKKPAQLSIGEGQRVAMARALVTAPSLVLADEPTSALDDVNCKEIIQLLENQCKDNGATLVIVTHDGRLKVHFNRHILLQ